MQVFSLLFSLCNSIRYKDDVEIFEEDGYDFKVQNQNACLKLQDVETEDAGSYTVEIENSAGELSKTFSLDVKGDDYILSMIILRQDENLLDNLLKG